MKNTLIILCCSAVLIFSCKKNEQSGGLSSTVEISPAQGYSGSLVTITGSGFSLNPDLDNVSFNGKPAEVVNVGATQLIVVVPDSAGSGPVTVTVGGKTAKGPDFSFTQNPMTITALSPAAGFPGNAIGIRGHGLVAASTGSLGAVAGITPQVSFNGKAANLISQSDTLLLVKVPQGAGNGPVSVNLAGNVVTGPIFTYTNVVSSSPSTGGPGTTLVITGTGFVADTGNYVITFGAGNLRGTMVGATATQLTVLVPTGVRNSISNGALPIAINGYPTSLSFTVVPGPIISSMIPTSGPAGTTVTFTGSNLNGGTATFNGVATNTVSSTVTRLVVTVPATATTGTVVVMANNQPVAGPKFVVQPLGLFALSPAFGRPGTVDTLTGTGFSTNPSSNTVTVGGLTAVVQSATATQLVVTMPQGLADGADSVTVSTGGLVAGGLAFQVGAQVYTYAGGPNAGLFNQPAALEFDASGDLFVGQWNNGTPIVELLPGGTVTTSTLPSFQPPLNSPSDLLFDKQGNLYISNANDGVINFVSSTGVVNSIPTSAQYGGCLAMDGSGDLFFADATGNLNVYEYSAANLANLSSQTTVNISQTITLPNYNGHSFLYGAAFDAQGNLYVVDGGNYSGATGAIYKVVGPGTTNPSASVVVSGLAFPTAIAVDANGNLIVTEINKNVIDVIDPNSYQVTEVIGSGTRGFQNGSAATAQINQPWGLKVDAQNNIWVADQGNNAIREIIGH